MGKKDKAVEVNTSVETAKNETVNETAKEVATAPVAVETSPVKHSADQLMIMQDQKRRALAQIYMKEKKFPITISPFYAPYLGSVVMISLQGIPMYIPADGTTYLVPESYAAEAIQAMAQVDARQRKQSRLSNVRQNLETSIGAIKF